MANKNTVRKKIIDINIDNHQKCVSISGITEKTKLGHHFTTSVIGTHFIHARYQRVQKTVIADKNDTSVFQSATIIVDLTISDSSFLSDQ